MRILPLPNLLLPGPEQLIHQFHSAQIPAHRAGVRCAVRLVDLIGLSYRYNFCEHVGPDRFLESALLNQIHPDTQTINKVILEMNKIKKGSRTVELHKDVHVACLLLLAPDIRAEDPKVGNPIAALEIREACLKILPDLLQGSHFTGLTDAGHGDASLLVYMMELADVIFFEGV